jgi:hypothetical protein
MREIADRSGRAFSIVSEMLDDRNCELAEIARADDFIVSDRLVNLMMCQVSENKEYAAVFEELIDPEGSELYLKPADEYVKPGLPLSFYTLVEAARRRRDRGRLPRKGGGRRPAEILRRASEPGQVPADNDGRRRQDHRAGRVLSSSDTVTGRHRHTEGGRWSQLAKNLGGGVSPETPSRLGRAFAPC